MTNNITCNILYDQHNNNNLSKLFYSGEVLSGKVTINVPNEITLRGIYVNIEGKAFTRFTTTSGKYSSTNIGEECYISEKQYFVGGEHGETYIHAGTYNYTFRCDLPHALPSSMEGDFGYIRYYIKVKLDRPLWPDKTFTDIITIIRPLNLNDNIDNRRSISMSSGKKFNICCCFCFCMQSKELMMTVALPIRGFVPNQQISAHVKCSNRSNHHLNRITMSIVKILDYIANSTRTKKEFIVLVSKSLGGCQKGSIKEYISDINVPETVTPTDLTNNVCKVRYVLRFEGITNTCCHDKLKLDIPIIMGTLPVDQSMQTMTTLQSNNSTNFLPTNYVSSTKTSNQFATNYLPSNYSAPNYMPSTQKSPNYQTQTNLTTSHSIQMNVTPSYSTSNYSTENYSATNNQIRPSVGKVQNKQQINPQRINQQQMNQQQMNQQQMNQQQINQQQINQQQINHQQINQQQQQQLLQKQTQVLNQLQPLEKQSVNLSNNLTKSMSTITSVPVTAMGSKPVQIDVASPQIKLAKLTTNSPKNSPKTDSKNIANAAILNQQATYAKIYGMGNKQPTNNQLTALQPLNVSTTTLQSINSTTSHQPLNASTALQPINASSTSLQPMNASVNRQSLNISSSNSLQSTNSSAPLQPVNRHSTSKTLQPMNLSSSSLQPNNMSAGRQSINPMTTQQTINNSTTSNYLSPYSSLTPQSVNYNTPSRALSSEAANQPVSYAKNYSKISTPSKK